METTRTVPAALSSEEILKRAAAGTYDPREGYITDPGGPPEIKTFVYSEAGVYGQRPDGSARVCCVGEDRPGVGFVHSASCANCPNQVDPRIPATIPAARPSVPGEVPPSLERLLRDEAVAELIPLALQLAEREIETVKGPLFTSNTCRECLMSRVANAPLRHALSCVTGRVIGLAEALKSSSRFTVHSSQSAPANRGAMSQPDGHAADEYGEPWECRFDSDLDLIFFYDANGVALLPPMKLTESNVKLARRIIGSVNMAAGTRDITVDGLGGVQ